MVREIRVIACVLVVLASAILCANIGMSDEYTRRVNGPYPMSSCLGSLPPCDVCPGHTVGCQRVPDPLIYPWAVSGGGCGSGSEEQTCTEGEYDCGEEYYCDIGGSAGIPCSWKLYCN